MEHCSLCFVVTGQVWSIASHIHVNLESFYCRDAKKRREMKERRLSPCDYFVLEWWVLSHSIELVKILHMHSKCLWQIFKRISNWPKLQQAVLGLHFTSNLSSLSSTLIPPRNKRARAGQQIPSPPTGTTTSLSSSFSPPSLLLFPLSLGLSALFRHTPASFVAGSMGLAVCWVGSGERRRQGKRNRMRKKRHRRREGEEESYLTGLKENNGMEST